MKHKLLMTALVMTTSIAFGQLKYEMKIKNLPYCFSSTDTIVKSVYAAKSIYKFSTYESTVKAIQLYATKIPFQFDFSVKSKSRTIVDSINIYRSEITNVKNPLLSDSFDSLSHFKYTIEFCYKNKSDALKDYSTICTLFDVKTGSLPKKFGTGKVMGPNIYFHLDEQSQFYVQHFLYFEYDTIEEGKKSMYAFKMTFICNGIKDIK